MALSIIILTHNCYSKKGGCIETVLLSILNRPTEKKSVKTQSTMVKYK